MLHAPRLLDRERASASCFSDDMAFIEIGWFAADSAFVFGIGRAEGGY